MKMDFKKAKAALEPYRQAGDDEAFHATFDKCLEERLEDLDPEFLTAMQEYYAASKMARWCA